MATASDDEISRAVVAWTGFGSTFTPSRDDNRIVLAHGPDVALELVPIVHRLEDEFYESEARHRVADLVGVGDLAAAEFRARHPELSDEAVAALAWCYSYDFK